MHFHRKNTRCVAMAQIISLCPVGVAGKLNSPPFYQRNESGNSDFTWVCIVLKISFKQERLMTYRFNSEDSIVEHICSFCLVEENCSLEISIIAGLSFNKTGMKFNMRLVFDSGFTWMVISCRIAGNGHISTTSGFDMGFMVEQYQVRTKGTAAGKRDSLSCQYAYWSWVTIV